MNAHRAGSTRTRRYRLHPVRTIVALAVMAGALYGYLELPRMPRFAVELPGRDPRSVSTAGVHERLAATTLSGQCLALGVAPDGLVSALTLSEGGVCLQWLWPDGRTARVSLRLQGRPTLGAFCGSGRLALFVPGDAAGSGEGVLWLFRGGTQAAAGGSLVADHSIALEARPVAIVPAGEVLALIMDGPAEGGPDTCVTYDLTTGEALWRQQLEDGIFTAWAAPGGAPLLALGGVAFREDQAAAFLWLLEPSGRRLAELAVPDGPLYALWLDEGGSRVLAVTPDHLTMVTRDGETVWRQRFPRLRVERAALGPSGEAVLATARNTLCLGPDGRVRSRWRSPGLTQGSSANAGGRLAFGTSGGYVVLDGRGVTEAGPPWGGATESLAIAAEGRWVVRIRQGQLELFGPRPARP